MSYAPSLLKFSKLEHHAGNIKNFAIFFLNYYQNKKFGNHMFDTTLELLGHKNTGINRKK